MSVIGRGKRDIRLFSKAIEQIGSGTSASSALGEIVRLAAEATKATAASFYWVDEQLALLKPAVIYGLPPDCLKVFTDFPIGTQCCVRAVRHKKVCIVRDMLVDPTFAELVDSPQATGIRAAFSVPVFNGGDQCIGCLTCYFATAHMPTSYELERSEIFATLISIAIATHTSATDPGTAGSTSGQNPSALPAIAFEYAQLTKSPAL